MKKKDRITSLLYEVERLKHAQDKFRNYEYFKNKVNFICGFASGKDCDKDLYEETVFKISKILKV